MVDYEDRKHFGIICKIMLCEKDAQVFNKDMCPESDELDYRDLMRSGKFPERYGEDGEWQWGTPSDYMKGGRTKLLLYDRHERAITVESDVTPERMHIEKCECDPDTEVHFHYRNVMDPNTIKVLEKPIPKREIQELSGFKHFNERGDRSAYRLISKKDLDSLLSRKGILT